MIQESARFFTSPADAVARISRMLEEESWDELSSYYCLEGSTVDPATLRSGQFFTRQERPPVSHPGGFWRHRHPFPSGFRYLNSRPEGSGVVTVVVSIELDEGDGMVQTGMSEFRMIESGRGWQILPD